MHMSKKTRNTMKPPSQTPSSPVFEGVYNNARMLHFLTAVVGSTCDVRVKNGTTYEGIFKTLSSQCELAVDAVHKRSEGAAGDGGGGGEEGGGGGGSGPSSSLPKMEEITDTMIFSPADLVTMICRDVDLNYAIRDMFTDTAISASRVNGEHREKVLQRWDGGDSNGDNFDLEEDTVNGWDANEMFKCNEETYGVKSTYDSSLSMYTVPLEKGSSEGYRQREARAARLANEIEGSPQYRRRVSLENDEGKSEEDKYSAVVRERPDREGKYIPLPQRAREMGLAPANARGGASARPAARHMAPAASSSSSSASSSSSSPKPSADRSSPLAVRTAYSPHAAQSSPPAAPHPQADAACSSSSSSALNGVASRTSPKSQRPQGSRVLRTPTSQSFPAASRSPKPEAPPLDHPPLTGPAYLDSSPGLGPTPLFPVDVNEILGSASKERMESLAGPQEAKGTKAPTVQQRSQLDELRKFGKEFRVRLQSSSSPSAGPASSEAPQLSPAQGPADLPGSAPTQDLQQTSTTAATPSPTPTTAGAGPDGQSLGTPQPSRTPGSEDPRLEGGAEGPAVAVVQVRNSTLNPNAKEFLPVKGPTVLQKPAPAPTPPRHATPSPAPTPPRHATPSPAPTPPRHATPSPSMMLPPMPGGAGALYSNPPGPYLSYISPIPIQGHSIQVPQMYQYTMSAVSQGKYPRAKGPVVGARPEHHGSPASPMLQATSSAAGPPLVASPYPQSYLQYGQVLQAMPPHYHGQTMYSLLQGGARMLTQGAPQAVGPQYPGQAEGPPGPQQGMYASLSHHSGSMLQASNSHAGMQAPAQHQAPSPGHNQQGPAGPQPQSLYHSGLSAPTPPSMPPGHSPPQPSYSMQGYSLPPHQALSHGYPLSQLTQAHVGGGMSGPHHSAHGPPHVMLHYAPPQQATGSAPQHGPSPQQGAHQHYYIGPAQAVQMQPHPGQQLTFHPTGN